MAKITCGNCHSQHDSVAEVKACYSQPTQGSVVTATPPTERQIGFINSLRSERDMTPEQSSVDITTLDRKGASSLIESLLLRPVATRPLKDRSGLASAQEVPAGKYALVNLKEPDKLTFVEVSIGKPGTRWDGYTFVAYVVGAPGDFLRLPVKAPDIRRGLLARIAEDPAGAARLFGQNTGVCGVCGSPLTDPVSVSHGIGPVCRSKTGW